jgi:hypothetical protein
MLAVHVVIAAGVGALAGAPSPHAAIAGDWNVAEVFSNSDLVSLGEADLAARKIEPHVVGYVELTSGRIIAADPLTPFGAKPFERTVAPGRYRVTVYMALGRIAAAAMRFADGTPDHWEPALLPGQDIKALKSDEFFGYGVDAGLGCFMDAETLPLLDERDRIAQAESGSKYISYYDNVLDHELTSTGHDYVLHQPMPSKKGNVAIFSSGWGDGLYGSYWGLDKDGKPLVLLTDFNVIQNSDGRKEPKW